VKKRASADARTSLGLILFHDAPEITLFLNQKEVCSPHAPLFKTKSPSRTAGGAGQRTPASTLKTGEKVGEDPPTGFHPPPASGPATRPAKLTSGRHHASTGSTQPCVGPVAKRAVPGTFAAAPSHGARTFDHHLHRAQPGALVGTIAKGLLLRMPAGAPPVGARLHLPYVRLPRGDFGLAHGQCETEEFTWVDRCGFRSERRSTNTQAISAGPKQINTPIGTQKMLQKMSITPAQNVRNPARCKAPAGAPRRPGAAVRPGRTTLCHPAGAGRPGRHRICRAGCQTPPRRPRAQAARRNPGHRKTSPAISPPPVVPVAVGFPR